MVSETAQTAELLVLNQETDMLTAVVVEKPFVNTSAEADRLIALAKEKGKILTVFQSQYTSLPPTPLPLLC